MGYFDRNDKEFFNLFSGNRANLYFDIIEKFVKTANNRGNEISREHALKIVEFELELNKDISEKVAPVEILNELESHKWLDSYKSGNKFYYRLTPNALTQYAAMDKMDKEREGSVFEFRNSIAAIRNACKNYLEGKKHYNGDTGDFYIDFLKPVNTEVNRLRDELHKCEADLERQSKKINKEVTDINQLATITENVINGTSMKNYYRLLNDDGKFLKYQEEIKDTLMIIKYYNFNDLVNSYMKEEQVDFSEAEDIVSEILEKIIEFFDYTYNEEKDNISKIQRKCIKKIKNRLEVLTGKSSKTFDIAKIFLREATLELENGNQTDEISDKLQSFLRMNEFSLFEGEASLRKKIDKVVKVTAEFEDYATEDTGEYDFDSIIEQNNYVIQHNIPHTNEYIRETYGNREKIHSSELKITTEEECKRTMDIIKYAMDERNDFDYKITLLDEDDIVEGKGMTILNPFILEKR